MKDPEQLLAALWAVDEAPTRDPAFVFAVMEVVARRRFRLGVLALVPAAAAASAGLWALGPVIHAALEPMLAAVNVLTLADVGGGLAMATFLWAWVSGRLGPEGG